MKNNELVTRASSKETRLVSAENSKCLELIAVLLDVDHGGVKVRDKVILSVYLNFQQNTLTKFGGINGSQKSRKPELSIKTFKSKLTRVYAPVKNIFLQKILKYASTQKTELDNDFVLSFLELLSI